MSNTQQEVIMYGYTRAEILESVTDSLTYKVVGPGMVIAGYLSDAQEMIRSNQKGSNDVARQYINIAKMLMIEFKLGYNER